nr:type VII secretion target [Mycobacteroides abscessus]
MSLNVDADGLRRASARSDDLASELNSSNGAGSGGGSQPTASAVQAVHALISGVRADQAAYLSGRSGTLRAGANGYQNTDDGSANGFNRTM